MNKYDMTLRQLNHDRPLKAYYESHETREMTECIHLYDIKVLDDYNSEDVRKMISQQICLEEMMPIGLEFLRNNEMIKTEHYPGDLLSAVVRINKAYWKLHEDEYTEVNNMLSKTRERINTWIQILND